MNGGVDVPWSQMKINESDEDKWYIKTCKLIKTRDSDFEPEFALDRMIAGQPTS